jgi:hypothetical protein
VFIYKKLCVEKFLNEEKKKKKKEKELAFCRKEDQENNSIDKKSKHV